MATLFCFGLGYSARQPDFDVVRFGAVEAGVTGAQQHQAVRDAERAAELSSSAQSGITALAFDGTVASADLCGAIAQAEAVLVSVPPDASGDPVLAICGEALTCAARLRSIVYLSTVGVYGNYDGAWVDEASECRPSDERNRQRLAAERAWQDLGVRTGVPVAILRVAGIYGPGRNALAVC